MKEMKLEMRFIFKIHESILTPYLTIPLHYIEAMSKYGLSR